MNLHIMGGVECVRFFADSKSIRPSFVGNKFLTFDSPEYHNAISEAQTQGAGAFFSVNRTNGHGGKAKDIIAVRTFYVDIDGLKDKTDALTRLLTAELKPSAVVETRNGVHAYWYAVSQTPVDIARYRQVQNGLTKAFGGDDSAKDIARVLRIPGTLHQKNPEEPFLVRIVHQLPRTLTPYYSSDEILEVYPSPPEKEHVHVSVRNSPVAWRFYVEDLAKWEPIEGERNKIMLLSAGVAIAYGVTMDAFVSSMYNVVRGWNLGRNAHAELKRVATWAYERGNPIPAAVVRRRGVPIRRGI